MGESPNSHATLQFDRRVRLEFHGATITSDAGLLACRELDEALELTETATACVKGGVKVYQRGGAKLYQWTRQHDWERCRGLLKLGPSLSPDLNSSCCYA